MIGPRPVWWPPWPDYNRITDNLIVGGEYLDAAELADLRKQGVTHIIDCRGEAPPLDADMAAEAGLDYINLGTKDDFQPKPASWFHDGVAYARAVFEQGGTLYVHCAAGINRGPSMAYAILLDMGWSPLAARLLIKRNRPVARIQYAADALRAHDEARCSTISL